MKQEQKLQVREALIRYLDGFDTQSEAAKNLKDVSSATISHIKNNNPEMVSEKMWHHVARQVGFYCGEWNPADTGGAMLLRILFADAQHYNMSYGIAMGPGLGKTFTAKHYARENEHTFYIPCNEAFNRKSFIAALIESTGEEAHGTTPQMTQRLIKLIDEKNEPLIILDDTHKLKDRVLHFIITMNNCLAGKCGIVLMGRDELRQRIMEGVRLNKQGYDDIYKSIGRRFITLGQLGPKDIALVCHANGITDEGLINEIKENCGNDRPGTLTGLHNVAQLVQALRFKMAA